MGMTDQTQQSEALQGSTTHPTYDELEAEITRLKAELAQANSDLDDGEDEVNGLKTQVEALRKDVQQVMEDKKALSDQVEKDQALLSELLNVLQKELVTSEGAVEVLNRIIAERNEAREQFKRLAADMSEYRPQVPAEDVRKVAEKVKEAAAEAAGPTGHWVRERVDCGKFCK